MMSRKELTMRSYYGPYGNGMGMWFGVAGFIGTLLLIAVIVLVVLVVRRNKTPGAPVAPVPPTGVNPALQMLDHRLATGEIDIADYQARKAVLLGQGVPPQPAATPPPEDPAEPPKA
jgi:uncharacterized membrane protein